jgi:Tfp pilus assembly protein PilX
MALLILLVISIIGAALMLSVQVETKISGRDERRSHALSLAEAGIAEAVSRIRSGEVPDTLNPKMATQIFLVSPGNVPVLGSDSTALATAQPAGRWLNYTSATRGAQALTVTYRTDATRTKIYRYDQAKNPPIQTVSGQPIFVITATGRKGNDVRTVVTEVIPKPFRPEIKAAIVTDVDARLTGNSAVCGYNHRVTTPLWYGENGRGGFESCVPYETGDGDLPAVWSTGDIDPGGGSQSDGQPSPTQENQTGFYTGPWDPLGISQEEFNSLTGPAFSAVPQSLKGIIYIDNDGTPQNQSGAWGIQGTSGDGLLYVDGDLNLSGPFNFKGMVYVEGNLTGSGDIWVLGSVIVRGRSSVTMSGGSTVLYSSEAISLALSKYAGQFVTLSWREK